MEIIRLGLSDDDEKRPSQPASESASPPEQTKPHEPPDPPTQASSAGAPTQPDSAELPPSTPVSPGDILLQPETVELQGTELALSETSLEPSGPLEGRTDHETAAPAPSATLPAPPDSPVPELPASPPPPPPWRSFSLRSFLGQFLFVILLLLAAGGGALAGLVFVHSSDLPQIQQLMDYRPDVMTELYADDGTPIGSFALEHRVIVNYNQIPKVLKDAVLSIEDRHFEDHWGVDVIRVVRAALTDVMEWRRAQGASTLTMQLSRKLFFTPEKSFRRKFQEVLIAIQIERHFTKPQIFTLYCNQIELGHGNFGFAAAAQFYFGKRLDQLTLPEAALLAGLPRTPTGYSPLIYPDRARQRRNQVLQAMLENGKISEAEYREARSAPLVLNVQRWNNNIAPYFVEDVRLYLERKYGAEAVHEKGLRVYTTLNVHQQQIAEKALQEGLRVYDKRHGWRGPEENIVKDPPTLPSGLLATLGTYTHPDWRTPLDPGQLVHGLVIDVKPDHALVRFGEQTARVVPGDYAWTGQKLPAGVFQTGDVDLFLVKEIKGETLHVALDQHPQVQGAVLAIENSSGAIKAMVGGYDFEESKFNRARQAARQAGSSFKVYVYAQALLDGARPFDTIVDEPLSFPSASGPWSPHNYDGKYLGTITLLHALAESRNIPAVRLLERVGVDKVIKLCRSFGLTSRLAENLPLALGASDLTLLEHTSAFSTFPDDGVHIAPRLVERVTNYDGRLIDDFPPEVTDVVPAPIARLETSMLREVFFTGTATLAKSLAEKYPMAGKTGTTNDFSDGWFEGFTPSLTCGIWVGYDDHRTLGNKEEGARVALPIWMQFMEAVLKDRPVEDFPYSPRLTKPEQVEPILASTGTDRLLSQTGSAAPAAGATPATASPAPAMAVAPARNAGTATKPVPPSAAAGLPQQSTTGSGSPATGSGSKTAPAPAPRPVNARPQPPPATPAAETASRPH
ncbi:MAG: PBP1A family penicillin-binding protein [Terriglobia bacterium]